MSDVDFHAAHESFEKVKRRPLVSYWAYCRNCDTAHSVGPNDDACPDCDSYFDLPPEEEPSDRPQLRLIRGAPFSTSKPCGVLHAVPDSTAEEVGPTVGTP